MDSHHTEQLPAIADPRRLGRMKSAHAAVEMEGLFHGHRCSGRENGMVAGSNRFGIGGGKDVADGVADHIRHRLAEHGCQCRIGEQEAAITIADEDAVRRVVAHGAQQGAGFEQCGLASPAHCMLPLQQCRSAPEQNRQPAAAGKDEYRRYRRMCVVSPAGTPLDQQVQAEQQGCACRQQQECVRQRDPVEQGVGAARAPFDRTVALAG